MSKIQEALSKIQGIKTTVTETGIKNNHVVANPVARVDDKPNNQGHSKILKLDNDALRQAGLIAPDYHEELLAQQYRGIKRPLIAHAFGKRATKVEDGNLIMVCSALSGEGKTFTSINLALSMAKERDISVLLVDADVAKPHTSAMFGVHDELGLLDLLDSPEIPIQSLILPTDVDNLSVLPAGQPRNNATELLASSAMENICRSLSHLHRRQIAVRLLF